MKTKIQNLIILDASGSMIYIKQQAVDGVNETVQRHLNEGDINKKPLTLQT